jgi:hypothetical protein
VFEAGAFLRVLAQVVEGQPDGDGVGQRPVVCGVVCGVFFFGGGGECEWVRQCPVLSIQIQMQRKTGTIRPNQTRSDQRTRPRRPASGP